MLLRRMFYRWQVVAAIVLPLWLVVGAAIFDGAAGTTVSLLLSAPMLGVGMLIVAALIFARTGVRSARAVSWRDVGVLALWHAVIIAAGFRGPVTALFGALVVIVGLGAFWLAVWELVTAARIRLSEAMGAFTGAAAPQQVGHPTPGSDSDGPVIVVEERRP